MNKRESERTLGPYQWIQVGRILPIMLTMPEYEKLKAKMEREQNGKETRHQQSRKVGR